MRNGRVRQHPLHVVLRQRDEVRDDHRQYGEPPQNDRPDRRRRRELDRDDTKKGRESCSFYSGRHVAGDRCRRPLVDVGRPHVERHGRDLESEADHHQCHARIQEEVALSSPACHFGRHERQVRASRGPEKKSDPVQEKPARESAHEEVLEGGLDGSRISSIESRQDIHGQGHQLE